MQVLRPAYLVAVPSFYFILLYFNLIQFYFLELHPQHMEVPSLEVESELRLLAYATAIAMCHLSHVCNLCCSLRNAGSLTHWARPGIKLTPSWVLVGFFTHWTTTGTPYLLLKPRVCFKFSHPLAWNIPKVSRPCPLPLAPYTAIDLCWSTGSILVLVFQKCSKTLHFLWNQALLSWPLLARLCGISVDIFILSATSHSLGVSKVYDLIQLSPLFCCGQFFRSTLFIASIQKAEPCWENLTEGGN